MQGILNGEYSIPWNILSKLALKTYCCLKSTLLGYASLNINSFNIDCLIH